MGNQAILQETAGQEVAKADPKDVVISAMAEERKNAINATGRVTLPESVAWIKTVAISATSLDTLPRNVIKTLILLVKLSVTFNQVLATTARALDMFSGTALRQAAGLATDVERMVTWPETALRTEALMSASVMDAVALDTFQESAQLHIDHQEKTATDVAPLIIWLGTALMEQARPCAITVTRWVT